MNKILYFQNDTVPIFKL